MKSDRYKRKLFLGFFRHSLIIRRITDFQSFDKLINLVFLVICGGIVKGGFQKFKVQGFRFFLKLEFTVVNECFEKIV